MLNENYIVEKSNALVWAQMREYGAGELKILDTYLSRINARDPDSSVVTFTKSEYAALMGLDPDVRTSQIKNYTGSLLRNVVTIDLPDEGYVQYPLFSEAKCYYDKKLNQTVITIDCNSKLKQAFFDLAENGYVKYQLKNVIKLRSQYSIRLYTMLKSKPFGWTVMIEDLKRHLNATAKTYEEYKNFNKFVLKKAIEEINAETDINVEAVPIRQGRCVSAVKFTTTAKKTKILSSAEVEAEYEFAEVVDAKEGEPFEPDEQINLFASVLPEELSRDQVEVLGSLALDKVGLFSGDVWDVRMQATNYLHSKVMLMKASKNPVRDKFVWLKKAVAEDWQ